MKHLLHSITRPVKVHYKDILDSIEECSDHIDKLAEGSARAELRDMHTLQRENQALLQNTTSTINDLMNVYGTVPAQLTQLSNIQVNTDQRVFDLQLSQILTFTTKSVLPDPELCFHHSIAWRKGHKLQLDRSIGIWKSPKLRSWTSSAASALVVVKGTYSSRSVAKHLGFSVVENMRSSRIPVIWVLPQDCQEYSTDLTTIDLLKNLVYQAIRLNSAFRRESACALSCARIQSATTESEWFNILGSALAEVPLVYIVINIGSLGRKIIPVSDDFSLPLAFTNLFKQLASRDSHTVVKLILISYGDAQCMLMPGVERPQDIIVNVGPHRNLPRSRRHSRMSPYHRGDLYRR